jgi:uncharacterized repeat protein (TIGR01451 family)
MKLKTLALIAASSAISVSAYAQTEYNLEISNTANLTYTSGTDSRSAVSLPVIFKVDRKVTFNLSGTNTDRTVEPGETASSSYTLTNSSNAPISYTLAQPVADNVTYIIDDDATPGISNDDTRVTSLANPTTATPIFLSTADSAATATVTIYVEIDTDAAAIDGDTTNYTLTATAVEPTGTLIAGANAGDIIVAAAVDDPWIEGTVQTIADDTLGTIRTETGTYTVGAAIIALEKSVLILSDPISGTAGPGIVPKAIPDAVVQYTLTVKNTGSVAATVELTDLLSENFTKTATITSVSVNNSTPGTTPTLTAASTAEIASGFDELLTIPSVTVVAFDAAYKLANPSDTEASTVVTFEVVLK